MTDNTELKRLAEAATAGPWSMCGEADGSQGFEIIQDIWNEHGTHTGKDVVVYEWSDESDPLGVIHRADAEFIAAANPVAVLALIADLDEARNGMKHSCAIRLKKRIELLETQRDQLIADNERLRVDLKSVVRLNNENADLFKEKNDQLRAEIAGLKTGYEAYERVNAELKAENEALRKDAELHAQIQRAAGELPAGWEIRVCVEHESGYVELWDQDGCEVDFPNSCESLGLTVSDAIDAAMGKGEQP